MTEHHDACEHPRILVVSRATYDEIRIKMVEEGLAGHIQRENKEYELITLTGVAMLTTDDEAQG